MSVKIHPTSVVSDKAKLGVNVEIGPFCFVDEDVEIADNTKLINNVKIKKYTKIGKNCTIYDGASIGNIPQHLGFKGEKTFVEIGDNVTIREYCTIHRGTSFDDGITKIENNVYLMAYVHIAHDCKVGESSIFANNATLGGHVRVGKNVFIGGLTPVHQWCRIGDYAMIGGGAVVTKDIPPFTRAGRNPAKIFGLNIIGLRRSGFSNETIKLLKEAYKIIFLRTDVLEEGIKLAKSELPMTPEIKLFIEFLEEKSKRGIAPEASKKKSKDESLEE
ncbi:MAG: acyl-ACP--UDP-N-acetylglucosamine O-acyltransferase [Aquificae bacterium]|nr:acyl-ACP--UDP-N-acetylglucosamine O-acyltransferase [Aquificota bacterium]